MSGGAVGSGLGGVGVAGVVDFADEFFQDVFEGNGADRGAAVAYPAEVAAGLLQRGDGLGEGKIGVDGDKRSPQPGRDGLAVVLRVELEYVLDVHISG